MVLKPPAAVLTAKTHGEGRFAWGGFSCVAMLLLLLSGCKAAARETVIAVPAMPAEKVEPVPSATEVAAAQHVSADTLYTIYSQNLMEGANPGQRFYNRLLLVHGVFNGVNRSLSGRTYLELRTHDPGAFTYAELNPAAGSLLTTLQPGQSMDLLCRGDGMDAGSPLLRDCRSQ